MVWFGWYWGVGRLPYEGKDSGHGVVYDYIFLTNKNKNCVALLTFAANAPHPSPPPVSTFLKLKEEYTC